MPEEKNDIAVDKVASDKEVSDIKKLKFLTVGTILLLIGIAVMVYFIFGSSSEGNGSDSSYFSSIPIFVAIFVPLFAKRKKDQTVQDKEKMLMLMLGLAFLMLVGVIVSVALTLKVTSEPAVGVHAL